MYSPVGEEASIPQTNRGHVRILVLISLVMVLACGHAIWRQIDDSELREKTLAIQEKTVQLEKALFELQETLEDRAAPPEPPKVSPPKAKAAKAARQRKVVPIEPFWDGEMRTFPKPIPKGFGGPPLPEAVGRRAYVTLLDIDTQNAYTCLALALMSSLASTNPDPSIDRIVAVVQPTLGLEYTPAVLRRKIGDKYYNAFLKAGVKFIVWPPVEFDKNYFRFNGLFGAYAKFRVWTMVQYEKVVFLDADTLILRNIDHLFEHQEFTAAAVWMGNNPNSPKTPSGGFWVVEPRMQTFELIKRYLAGRDPCGMLWHNADMTMLKVLFTDLNSYANPNRSENALSDSGWPSYDGDVQILGGDPKHLGKCLMKTLWPLREDMVFPIYDKKHPPSPKPTPYISAENRWHALNESYDLLVNPCDQQPLASRYNVHPEGNTLWERAGAFSLHLSPGLKPHCEPAPLEYKEPDCKKEVFSLWRRYLRMYMFN